MSDMLKKIYNACDPYKPASAEQYLDCSVARGASALTANFLRHLDLCAPRTTCGFSSPGT